MLLVHLGHLGHFRFKPVYIECFLPLFGKKGFLLIGKLAEKKVWRREHAMYGIVLNICLPFSNWNIEVWYTSTERCKIFWKGLYLCLCCGNCSFQLV